MKHTINVLGTNYSIEKRDYNECEEFEKYNWAGFCEEYNKRIVVGNIKTFPDMANESEKVCAKVEKHNLRHEIIHAFLNESGLSSCSMHHDAWAKNEEMVDWLAIQLPKIYQVFKALDLL